MQCIVLPAMSAKWRALNDEGHSNSPTGMPLRSNISMGDKTRRLHPMTILAPGVIVGTNSVKRHRPIDCDTSIFLQGMPCIPWFANIASNMAVALWPMPLIGRLSGTRGTDPSVFCHFSSRPRMPRRALLRLSASSTNRVALLPSRDQAVDTFKEYQETRPTVCLLLLLHLLRLSSAFFFFQ